MSITTEIIDWVKDKPLFWQEAVGRILLKNILTESDFLDLKKICKSEEGLETCPKKLVDLDQVKESLEESEVAKDISIVKISDTENINAIGNGSKINIEKDGLTVIYGDNGSGKSSYVSILKQICNTRGKIPTIHQNLFLNLKEAQNQKAKVHYKSGENSGLVTWENQAADSRILRAVHIFDTKSACSYIEDEDEIAFKPSGLLIIEKLANACNEVKEKIKEELQQLLFQRFDYSFLKTGENNEIQNFLENLSSKSDLKKLEEIGSFAVGEEKLLEITENKIAELRALDPTKKILENNKIVDRFNILRIKYEQIKNQLPIEKIEGIKKDVLARNVLQKAVEILTKKTFLDLPIAGVGSQSWKGLWESARKFHEHSTQQKFPDSGDAPVCPLCLQGLDDEAKKRFINFEEFVRTDIQNQLNTVNQRWKSSMEEIKNINLNFLEIKSTIAELNGVTGIFTEQHDKVIELITTYISFILELSASPEKTSEFVAQKIDINLITIIEKIVAKIEEKNKALLKILVDEKLKEQEKVFSHLKSKKELFENKEKIKNELKRQKNIKLLNSCLSSCNTMNVSLFSNSLSEKYVTAALKENFKDELEKLDFKNIKITTSTRGSGGRQVHSLTLDYGRDIDLKDILSEGEHRCISLATFLSELSVCEHKSAIVFDDPVSSLDHKWRSKIARRVVVEATERQVIVFTHDITFLMNLSEFSDEINIQGLTRKLQETGVVLKNPPWDALKITKRIGILNQMLQKLEEIECTETEEIYRGKVGVFYGRLRETWERCVEEVVLNGVVQRFGRSIQTQKLEKVADFSKIDYKIIDENMSKCSKYLNGHDSAEELIERTPTSAEIKTDIKVLEDFAKGIRRRRRS